MLAVGLMVTIVTMAVGDAISYILHVSLDQWRCC